MGCVISASPGAVFQAVTTWLSDVTFCAGVQALTCEGRTAFAEVLDGVTSPPQLASKKQPAAATIRAKEKSMNTRIGELTTLCGF